MSSDSEAVGGGGGAPGEHCAGALAEGGLHVAIVERVLVGATAPTGDCAPPSPGRSSPWRRAVMRVLGRAAEAGARTSVELRSGSGVALIAGTALAVAAATAGLALGRHDDRVPTRGGRPVESPPVLLAIVGDRIEADLMVGLLLSHGLRAAVTTDDAGGQEPQLQLQGGVRVLVASSDEAPARRLLAATDDAAARVEGS